MRILLTEDDRALGTVVRRGLVEEGHAVDWCTTAVETDEALAVETYDLVVLDIGLPDGSGIEVCQRLRATGNEVKVLMLTARDALSDKVTGLDAGADDYLTKPFDFPELAARVRALLRRAGDARAPVLEWMDVRLDPAAHRVWRGAVAVPVTPKEFGLLHFMLSHPDRVVTRTELLEHVWDANYDGMSNTVDVHVANLRRKLTAADADDVIETVRGVGYRLVEPGERSAA